MVFKIEITSPPDREGVVAEIWADNEMFAELSFDAMSSTLIELYTREDGSPWRFELRKSKKHSLVQDSG